MSVWEKDVKTVECNISQLSGYFQAEEDIKIRNNALRMLDELEIILKKLIEVKK